MVPSFSPRSFCAYEKKPTRGTIVVSRVYAATICDENPEAFDEDHSTIVKPPNRQADIYVWVQKRIQDAMKGRPTTSAIRLPSSRIRKLQVTTFSEKQNPAGFPGLTIFYDNAGTVGASSVVSHFAVGFASGRLTDSKVNEYQDTLLNTGTWQKDMAARAGHIIYPGDPGEFTSIPFTNDDLAADFRRHWSDVVEGKMVLYVFVTFKYRDVEPDNSLIGVTEYCFWISGSNLAQHNCGRNRSFVEPQSAAVVTQ